MRHDRGDDGGFARFEPWVTNVCLAARKHGLLTRPIGNTIVLMPPLCVTLDEIERMVKALRAAMDEVTAPPR
jgi:adenosylmethionine-8-amino-7-oxononanoate aminotransferase